MNTFSERLQFVLAGRKIHPWASSLGISNGAVDNIRKGTIFGAEILKAIRDCEQVNLGWLVSGDGNPFLVEHCDDAEALRQAWQQSGEQKVGIYLLSDGRQLAIIRHWVDIYEYKSRHFSYDHHQLLTLALTSAVIEQLVLLCRGMDCYEGQLTPEQLGELVRGEAGSFPVFGNQKIPGLLTIWKPLSESMLQEKLLALAETPQPGSGEVSRQLMRAVIELVEDTAFEEGIELDTSARARAYTALYRQAIRSGLDWQDIDRNTVRSLLDML